MGQASSAFLALAAGCALVILGIAATKIATTELWEARAAYTRCVADGAPRETCIKNYLLPEEKP